MSTLSSANVTDVNLVLKERTHMRLCINMLIFAHNLGNWLIQKCKRVSVVYLTNVERRQATADRRTILLINSFSKLTSWI